jgi:hypothetical protein
MKQLRECRFTQNSCLQDTCQAQNFITWKQLQPIDVLSHKARNSSSSWSLSMSVSLSGPKFSDNSKIELSLASWVHLRLIVLDLEDHANK